MMKNELWGIRWNEERVASKSASQARKKLQQQRSVVVIRRTLWWVRSFSFLCVRSWPGFSVMTSRVSA
jgi:hypothetical protein